MTQKDITNVRGLVEFLKSENEILITTEEVDPIYEVAGIQKAFEDGPAELFGWAKSNVNILTDDQPPFNREMGSANLRGILCKVSKV